MVSFVEEVHGVTNTLLKAVLADAKEPWCLAGARALGILGKHITSPLWRVLEDNDIPISEIGSYYSDIITCMSTCIENQEAMSQFITGEKVPDRLHKYLNKDDTWIYLVKPDQTDSDVKLILRQVFTAWTRLLEHLVADHLPGGRFAEMHQRDKEATASTMKHNKLCEEIFGHLDRLIRLRPNATTLAHEAHIIFGKSKVSQWPDNLSEEDRTNIINQSSTGSRLLRESYKKRRATISEHKKKKLKEKQLKIEAYQQKCFREKERLTNDIRVYGLWQSPSQVDEKLSTFSSTSGKMNALKAQLNFRRTVLGQPGEKKLFQMSSAQDGKFKVEKVAQNLKKLITDSCSLPPVGEDSESVLVGKRIRHRFEIRQNQDNMLKWFTGTVINQVPGFNEWFHVVYDGEDEVCTFRLREDLEAGDLELLTEQFPVARYNHVIGCYSLMLIAWFIIAVNRSTKIRLFIEGKCFHDHCFADYY